MPVKLASLRSTVLWVDVVSVGLALLVLQLNIWEGFLEEEAKSALDSQILSAPCAASEAEG